MAPPTGKWPAAGALDSGIGESGRRNRHEKNGHNGRLGAPAGRSGKIYGLRGVYRLHLFLFALAARAPFGGRTGGHTVFRSDARRPRRGSAIGYGTRGQAPQWAVEPLRCAPLCAGGRRERLAQVTPATSPPFFALWPMPSALCSVLSALCPPLLASWRCAGTAGFVLVGTALVVVCSSRFSVRYWKKRQPSRGRGRALPAPKLAGARGPNRPPIAASVWLPR